MPLAPKRPTPPNYLFSPASRRPAPRVLFAARSSPAIPSPTALLLPYAQATPAQHAQALHYVRERLRPHFPTLPERAFAQALEEFRPELLLSGPRVALVPQDLTQLAQHLAASPELPLLAPPLYGLPALALAQYVLHTGELAARVLPELAAQCVPCGPRLWHLLQRLVDPYSLAEQVVQAWRWDLPSSPPLPLGIPGGGPTAGSAEAQHYLAQLKQTTGGHR